MFVCIPGLCVMTLQTIECVFLINNKYCLAVNSFASIAFLHICAQDCNEAISIFKDNS